MYKKRRLAQPVYSMLFWQPVALTLGSK